LVTLLVYADGPGGGPGGGGEASLRRLLAALAQAQYFGDMVDLRLVVSADQGIQAAAAAFVWPHGTKTLLLRKAANLTSSSSSSVAGKPTGGFVDDSSSGRMRGNGTDKAGDVGGALDDAAESGETGGSSEAEGELRARDMLGSWHPSSLDEVGVFLRPGHAPGPHFYAFVKAHAVRFWASPPAQREPITDVDADVEADRAGSSAFAAAAADAAADASQAEVEAGGVGLGGACLGASVPSAPSRPLGGPVEGRWCGPSLCGPVVLPASSFQRLRAHASLRFSLPHLTVVLPQEGPPRPSLLPPGAGRGRGSNRSSEDGGGGGRGVHSGSRKVSRDWHRLVLEWVLASGLGLATPAVTLVASACAEPAEHADGASDAPMAAVEEGDAPRWPPWPDRDVLLGKKPLFALSFAPPFQTRTHNPVSMLPWEAGRCSAHWEVTELEVPPDVSACMLSMGSYDFDASSKCLHRALRLSRSYLAHNG
jgi:hypothetical protein